MLVCCKIHKTMATGGSVQDDTGPILQIPHCLIGLILNIVIFTYVPVNPG